MNKTPQHHRTTPKPTPDRHLVAGYRAVLDHADDRNLPAPFDLSLEDGLIALALKRGEGAGWLASICTDTLEMTANGWVQATGTLPATGVRVRLRTPNPAHTGQPLVINDAETVTPPAHPDAHDLVWCQGTIPLEEGNDEPCMVMTCTADHDVCTYEFAQTNTAGLTLCPRCIEQAG